MHERLKCFGLRAWLVLCLSLVLMQTLGVAHRVVHAKLAATTAVHASEVGSSLWGEHNQASDCQQFDQSCGDALQHTITIAGVLPWWPEWPTSTRPVHLTAFERLYAARAPPVSLL